MRCDSLNGYLTLEGCRRNQQLARIALEEIDGGKSAFQLDDYMINRLIVCGRCPECKTLNQEYGRLMFREAIDELIHKVDNYNEWGHDVDTKLVTRKAREARYRGKHPEDIKERTHWSNVDRRIKLLKERLEGKNGETDESSN